MTADQWMLEILRGVLTPHGFLMALFALATWLKSVNMFGRWLFQPKEQPTLHSFHDQSIPEFVCYDCDAVVE